MQVSPEDPMGHPDPCGSSMSLCPMELLRGFEKMRKDIHHPVPILVEENVTVYKASQAGTHAPGRGQGGGI